MLLSRLVHWTSGQLLVLVCQTESRDDSGQVSFENCWYDASLCGVRSPLTLLTSGLETRNSYVVVTFAEQRVCPAQSQPFSSLSKCPGGLRSG